MRDDTRGSAAPVGPGNRLAYLLQPPRQPGDDGAARLSALEAQVAALTARLAELEMEISAVAHALVADADAGGGERVTGKGRPQQSRLPPFLR